jgi:hypothetical protein
LDTPQAGKRLLGLFNRSFISLVLQLIIGKVSPEVFDIEPSLGLGVKSDEELIQPCLSYDKYDLVFR